MIYHLLNALEGFLKNAGAYGLFRPLKFAEFRAVLAVLLAFILVVGLGNRTIRLLLRLKIGDLPEFYHKDLNLLMKDKANTPTMGGALISGAILVVTLLLARLDSFYVLMALICMLVLAGVGGVDDYLKLTAARRKPGSREGLYLWEKLVFQVGLAVILGLFVYHHGQHKQIADPDRLLDMGRSLNLPFVKSWQLESLPDHFVPSPDLWVLGPLAFVCITIIVLVGSSNAVNLTDGMDGLASGIVAICAFAFAVLAYIAGAVDPLDGSVLAQELLVPHIPLADELAVVAGAMVGACVGFLWFNCNPAQVFMGDTGSLPLGGLLGYIAVVIRQEFLLLIIGGVLVFEVVSVVLQVLYFKLSGGKRIFRCAPVHHHFHLGGWTEQQVVVRFWLITAVLATAAIATIKLR